MPYRLVMSLNQFLDKPTIMHGSLGELKSDSDFLRLWLLTRTDENKAPYPYTVYWEQYDFETGWNITDVMEAK